MDEWRPTAEDDPVGADDVVRVDVLALAFRKAEQGPHFLDPVGAFATGQDRTTSAVRLAIGDEMRSLLTICVDRSRKCCQE
jgi:hypothetical protein